jgi:hypothetical protein
MQVDLGQIAIHLVGGLAILTLVGFLANRRGFNIWLWILPAVIIAFGPGAVPASGILGMIVLLCMPSAAAKDIDMAIRGKRRRTGSIVAVVLTMIAFVLVVALWVLMFNMA